MTDSIQLRPIKTFGILGAGTLGWKIGLQAAISGYDVLLHDLGEAELKSARNFQDKFLRKLAKQGRLTTEELPGISARISTTTDASEFAKRVDFVSESVTEQVELKRKVWGGFAGKWQENTVLTTNTSYLLPSMIADVVGETDRFCAFHFHDVFDARVVDVMPHPTTDASVCDMLMKLGSELNQIPVFIKKETQGYLFNAMLMSYLGAAGALLAGEKASIKDIDRSWMGNFDQKVGPFGMMDVIGLDTVEHVLSGRHDKRSAAFRGVIKPYVEAGKLGVKTGEGFYSYPNPAYMDADFLG